MRLSLMPFVCLSLLGAQSMAASSTGIAWRAGLGQRGEDLSWEQLLLFSYLSTTLEVSLALPLVGIWRDHNPANELVTFLGLPREHWDEAADWLRWLHQLRIGAEDDAAMIHAGLLVGERLGSGALVDRFYSRVDPDMAGVALRGVYQDPRTRNSLRLWLLDPVQPSLLATELNLHPLALGSTGATQLRGVGVGFVGVLDPTAPGEEAAESAPIAALSAELFWRLEPSTSLSVTPRVTSAWLPRAHSLHAGLDLTWSGQLASQDMELEVRAELMRAASWVVPFGPVYTVERSQFPLSAGQQASPFMLARRDADLDAARLGWRVASDVVLAGVLRAGASWLAHGERLEMLVYCQLALQERISLGSWAWWRRLDWESQGHATQAARLLALEAAALVWGPVSVYARYGHWPRRNQAGVWRPVHDWSLGLGYEVVL